MINSFVRSDKVLEGRKETYDNGVSSGIDIVDMRLTSTLNPLRNTFGLSMRGRTRRKRSIGTRDSTNHMARGSASFLSHLHLTPATLYPNQQFSCTDYRTSNNIHNII
jgi:hypothetical protein